MKKDDRINILVLGSGGREHAMTHALSKSGITGELHCAPGNPGIMELAVTHSADIRDGAAVLDLCAAHDIALVVIGPEAPLAAGVADILRQAGIRVFGPGRDGAMLESSKAFSKKFMRRHGIPTPDFDICATLDECRLAISKRTPPYVVKADGLAAGKGVFLSDDESDAIRACEDLIVHKKLGEAGSPLVIEDFAPGLELTVFAVTDGESYITLPPSRDHKRAHDGDRGPNTGGMGAYSPVSIPRSIMGIVEDAVLRPTLNGLRSEGIDYRGVIYMGLMITRDASGEDKISVIEYNVRFGDPETQAVLPLLDGDFASMLLSCAEGRIEPNVSADAQGAALCVVLASGGYPGEFRRGLPIAGLNRGRVESPEFPGSFVYHAGTAAGIDGEFVTAGGRVLTVVGLGDTFKEARDRAYTRISAISFEDMRYRSDIGWSEE
ncbi:MAG: phosphoribosylamine--glycine ligase [Synergistaceae bacterium]|jgi:phosphoribosylamine--glycine ligase|nr:phosphoribosylamine--glycine ligase [Synergistaceae bacterium]